MRATNAQAFALVLQSQLPDTGWIFQRIANIQLRTWCLHVIEACQSSGSKSPVYWMCDCSISNYLKTRNRPVPVIPAKAGIQWPNLKSCRYSLVRAF